MAARRTARAVFASFVLAALAAQAFVAVVESRASPAEKTSQGDDVKKPDCVPGMDPRSFPGIGGGHGGGITPVTPSHGGSTRTTPSPGGGSGYVPTPSHGGTTLPSPSHGGFGSSPTAPSTGSSPSHGGGAYGGSPSTPGGGGGGGAYGGGSPSPAHGGGGAYGSSPTPAYGGSSPSHSGGIGTSSPTPLVAVDPHSFGSLPGSCDYWRSHPMEVWSSIGARFPSTSPSSMGRFFGGPDVSIQDALANTRSDGTGALLREGAAALLNSMTRAGFPYTTDQVRDTFAAAAVSGSDGAAAAQAAVFRKANEGKA